MSNSGYITFKKNIDIKSIIQDIHDTNIRFFDSKITVELGEVLTIYVGENYQKNFGFKIWKCSPRKLEHTLGSNFGNYLCSIFTNNIALINEAKLSGEGMSGSWQPDIKYKDYSDYIDKNDLIS